MISVNDFKTGLTISVDNGIWKVIDFQHVKPGKGSAFVRSKLRNLRTGAMLTEIIMYLWIMKALNKQNFQVIT